MKRKPPPIKRCWHWELLWLLGQIMIATKQLPTRLQALGAKQRLYQSNSSHSPPGVVPCEDPPQALDLWQSTLPKSTTISQLSKSSIQQVTVSPLNTIVTVYILRPPSWDQDHNEEELTLSCYVSDFRLAPSHTLLYWCLGQPQKKRIGFCHPVPMPQPCYSVACHADLLSAI